MKIKCLLFVLTALIISSCAPKIKQTPPLNTDIYINASYPKHDVATQTDTLTLVDSSRNMLISIATCYAENSGTKSQKKQLVILNPGYGGKNTDCQYISKDLAVSGYFVVTIQHDLATDDSLPGTGDIYKLRKPVWDRGLKNIFFVTEKIKRKYPQLDYDHIILIGYSDGGDIAMLMANEYPEFAKIVISLDNRRVPIPRSGHPKMLSIRSSDQSADPGVLPSPDEQKKYNVTIFNVKTLHKDMGGTATGGEKWKIQHYI